jgi:hypothetical protein
MADLVLNAGDLFPALTARLEKQNEETGKWEALDLTGATAIKVYMAADRTEVEGTCTVVGEAEGGEVTYEWAAGDTDVPETYRGQFRLTLANGKPQRVPNKGYFTVEIQPNLGEE